MRRGRPALFFGRSLAARLGFIRSAPAGRRRRRRRDAAEPGEDLTHGGRDLRRPHTLHVSPVLLPVFLSPRLQLSQHGVHAGESGSVLSFLGRRGKKRELFRVGLRRRDTRNAEMVGLPRPAEARGRIGATILAARSRLILLGGRRWARRARAQDVALAALFFLFLPSVSSLLSRPSRARPLAISGQQTAGDPPRPPRARRLPRARAGGSWRERGRK